MLKNRSSSKLGRGPRDIRFRSKQRGRLSGKVLSQPRVSHDSIPLEKLLKSCPLLTPEILKRIQTTLQPGNENVKIEILPDDVIQDLFKRGLIHNNSDSNKVQKIIDKLRSLGKHDKSANIPELVKEVCINRPISELNPNFEIVDKNVDTIAACRDLNKYLDNKLIFKSSLPKLPVQIQNLIDKIPSADIKMNDLPLSILVEMCKYNDVDLDKSAIDTLTNLLSDILKPKRRIGQDYKHLMRNLKNHHRHPKSILLSPSAKFRKAQPDKSLLHPPQALHASHSNSKFLLPSDIAGLSISRRFKAPEFNAHLGPQNRGYLSQRSKIHSPVTSQERNLEGYSTTQLESMHRFFPAHSDVSMATKPAEGRLEGTGYTTLNPNSFFRDPTLLYSSRSKGNMSGRRGSENPSNVYVLQRSLATSASRIYK